MYQQLHGLPLHLETTFMIPRGIILLTSPKISLSISHHSNPPNTEIKFCCRLSNSHAEAIKIYLAQLRAAQEEKRQSLVIDLANIGPAVSSLNYPFSWEATGVLSPSFNTTPKPCRDIGLFLVCSWASPGAGEGPVCGSECLRSETWTGERAGRVWHEVGHKHRR